MQSTFRLVLFPLFLLRASSELKKKGPAKKNKVLWEGGGWKKREMGGRRGTKAFFLSLFFVDCVAVLLIFIPLFESVV